MSIRLDCRHALSLLILLALAGGCVPGVSLEPTVEFGGDSGEGGTALAVAPPSPSPAPYPPVPTLLPPYPWPTVDPGPTEPPEPTEAPTETIPPLPTLPPTPVVTPIPTAAPTFSSFTEGTVSQPFTVYYREGDVIRSLDSAEAVAPQLFLDPLAEFGHLLPPSARLVPDWGALSPDGQTLALVLTDDPTVYAIPNSGGAFWPAPHPTDLYLFDMTTRQLRLLASDGFLPVWSPDGQRVAYRSTDTLGLWVVDAASGTANEVYAVAPLVYGEDAHFAGWFSWAYDSRRLVVLETDSYTTHKWMIVDADGLEAPRPVNQDPLRPIRLMQWSPRDDRLAFLQPGPGRQPLTDLWLINGDLSGQTQLTRSLEFPGFAPLWSSDGRWLAISGIAPYEGEYASYDLWLIEPDSAALYRLTYDTPVASYEELNEADSDIYELWSPDGTQLFYLKGSHQMWLMSLIDGQRRQLIQSDDVLFNSGIIVGP